MAIKKNHAIGDPVKAVDINDLTMGLSGFATHQQATPDLTLKVEAGVVNIQGTIVKYDGGNSPSFTAPSANPRIDLLTIDDTGTLARTAGTEAASPSAPGYPTDKYVICEVYNRVGQTAIYNVDQTTNGYILRDTRSQYMQPSPVFGDGSDGDVTISSPTTLTRDMYYDDLVVNDTLTTDGYKIYVRGTLSGNGTIKAPDPVAAVDATPAAVSGTGPLRGVAGAAGATSSNGENGAAGSSGSIGSNASAGGNGGSASSNSGGTGGAGGTLSSASTKIVENFHAFTFGHITSSGFSLRVPSGAGSGGKGAGAGVSPAGGNGGAGGSSGGIVWIAASVWSGSFTIRAVGGNGGNGGNGSSGGGAAGGGGGGAGGNGGISFVVYGSKTWTGSYTLTGGTGGTGGTGLDGSSSAEDGIAGSNGASGTSIEYQYIDLL